MENAIAITQFEAAHQHPEDLRHNNPGGHASSGGQAPMDAADLEGSHLALPAGGAAEPVSEAHKQHLEAALAETQQLRMEIAGMEALMGAVKGALPLQPQDSTSPCHTVITLPLSFVAREADRPSLPCICTSAHFCDFTMQYTA